MLEELNDNFLKLVALYEAKDSEAKKLQAELSECRASNDSYRKQISELKRQIDNLNLSSAFKGGADSSSAAKAKIDKLIKEIDRCIALLGQD